MLILPNYLNEIKLFLNFNGCKIKFYRSKKQNKTRKNKNKTRILEFKRARL